MVVDVRTEFRTSLGREVAYELAVRGAAKLVRFRIATTERL